MDEAFGGLQQSDWCMILYENPLVPRKHDGVVCTTISDMHEKQMGGKWTLHLGGE